MKKQARIVFMGTPEFAVASLQHLVEAGKEVVGVVTVPDKPAGRGKKLRPSAVKVYAQSQEIPLLQPVKLRDPAFIQALKDLKPDLMVVVAFRMLPEMVWSLPSIGTFNLHASYLPDYRGAAPINWVIINGEKETGVTTFFIDKKIDTGNILLQEKIAIQEAWTAGDLHDVLMEEGARLVLETVEGLEEGQLKARPQDDSAFQHPAPKIFKEDCQIDWNQDAQQVLNFIKGLSPYPAAFTYLEGKPLKIFDARMGEASAENAKPGQIRADQEAGWMEIACASGWLSLTSLQLEGKKKVAVADFLRGYRGELKRVGEEAS